MTDLTPTEPDDDGPSLADLTAPSSSFDMGALLEQAMGMQQELLEAQARAAEAVVEGQAGGGVVRVRVTGGMVFEGVSIAPEAVDPSDLGELEDLVLAALNDAMDGIARLQQQSMGSLDLGAVGGMLGLGGPADGDDTGEPGDDDAR